MTWRSRLRLSAGIVVVVAIVAACTLLLTQRSSRLTSATAQIQAEQFPVGSDYSGTVVERFATAGDVVDEGDPLVTLVSSALARDQGLGETIPSTPSALVEPGGRITLISPTDGIVASLQIPVGGYVPAGSSIGHIDGAGTMSVLAQYMLSARDYARVDIGALVELTLPNEETLHGTVRSVDVSTQGGLTRAQVTVDSDELRESSFGGIVTPGTPVSAALQLRRDGPLDGVAAMLRDLLKQVGL